MPVEKTFLEKLLSGVVAEGKDSFKDDLNSLEKVEAALTRLPMPLSDPQRDAIIAAWRNEISYVQGPPGTGKSHTITAIMLAGLLLDKRVLLVSHKKAAINVVFKMISDFLGMNSVVHVSDDQITRGRIATGLRNWADGSNVGTAAETQEQRLQGEFESAQRHVADFKSKIATEADSQNTYYRQHRTLLAKLHQHRAEYPDSGTRLEQLIREADPQCALAHLGHLEVRMQDSEARKTVLHFQRFAAACKKRFLADESWCQNRRAHWSINLLHLKNHLEICNCLQQLRATQSRLQVGFLPGLRNELKLAMEELQRLGEALLKARMPRNIVRCLEDGVTRRSMRSFAAALDQPIPKRARRYFDSIDFEPLVKAFPLWVVELRHVNDYLPFKSGLFDLVVVDEASQVNIAEVIPAFFRGSQICVLGDDEQLGLDSAGLFGISQAFEKMTWNKHFPGEAPITYGRADQSHLLVSKHSILDFVSNLPAVRRQILNEHFRSLPPLALFTSMRFYEKDGGLRLMKELPKNIAKQCFNAIAVGGNRLEDRKVVPNEVEKAMEILRNLIHERRFDLLPGLGRHEFSREHPSIGVISFLTDQRDEIRDRVIQEFDGGDQINKHELFVGTAEDFQGNERDITIITLGLDGSQKGVGFWEDERRFNVATSRAIHYTVVIYGAIPRNANLIRGYLRHFGFDPVEAPQGLAVGLGGTEAGGAEKQNFTEILARYRWSWNRGLCESEFEQQVAEVLEEFQWKHGGEAKIQLFNQVQGAPKVGVESCGQKRLDFVVLNKANGECVAVEVDGQDHFVDTALGGRYSDAHLERVAVLVRAGWKIVHVPYYSWWRDGWLTNRDEPEFQRVISNLFAELRSSLGLESAGPESMPATASIAESARTNLPAT